MSKLAIIYSVLAPVEIPTLSRADSLRVFGDQACETDDNGVALRPVDEAGNLMGAIAILWHDDSEARSSDIDAFLSGFSSHPFSIRREVMVDSLATPDGGAGRYFQNEVGATTFYEGYLLVAPDEDVIEEFFAEGRGILNE